MKLSVPENVILKPVITVMGVGGAGGNAINNMIDSNLQGIKFVVANTDAQALEHSKTDNKMQLGVATTKGLGAGATRETGALAAEESVDEIKAYLEGSNMLFITAGMGGGTGTGASHVVAKIAKEMGILTVAVVTKPFHFEGAHRMKTADEGLEELKQHVDTLIVIPNQNLFRIANENTTFTDAFRAADEVLKQGVQSITDLMVMPGLINLDFADINAIMSKMGKAMMGTGEASGEGRAVIAAETAIQNPLLDNSSMKGARGVLINITGADMTLFEVDAAANRIREEVDNPEANIIFGSTFDPNLEGVIRVSVVATGIESKPPVNNTRNIPNNVQKPYNKPTPHVQNQQVVDMIHQAASQEISQQSEPVKTQNIRHVPETDVPKFNEYDMAPNIQGREDHNENSIIEEQHASSDLQAPVRNRQEDEERGSSIISRMWDSLKGQESAQSNQDGHNTYAQEQFVNESNKSYSADVYEIPAFLRRK